MNALVRESKTRCSIPVKRYLVERAYAYKEHIAPVDATVIDFVATDDGIKAVLILEDGTMTTSALAYLVAS